MLMKHCPWIFRSLAAGVSALAVFTAQAAPVTLNLQGTITGYDYMDLGPAGLPLGTAVSLSLSFNETFSDGTYAFSDPLGPVSGAMTAGGLGYGFTGVNPVAYSQLPTGELRLVQLQFTGSGPALGSGFFSGLYANITPDLTLFDGVRLGYGYTTDFGNGTSVTQYGYAIVTASSYSITANGTGQVPVPATLPLVLLGLLALPATARRRAHALDPVSRAPAPRIPRLPLPEGLHVVRCHSNSWCAPAQPQEP
jgi:hypothetical protein